MKSKKLLFVIIIILTTILLIGSVIIFFSAKKQLEPKIKYAEFPFSLSYKVNEEITNINGTYVCEFEGIGWDTGRGFYKNWIGYVKETGLENVLIIEDSKRQIFCQVGDPRYYMENDYDLLYSDKTVSHPHLYFVKKSNDFDNMSVEQIKEFYHIEILSWKFSLPIENNPN